MDWERRLREMIFAGGALVATACSNGQVVPEEAGTPPDQAGCCNANSDPCCPVDYCGASMNPQCACEREGEVYDVVTATCAPPTSLNGGDAGCCSGDSEAGTDGGVLDASLGTDAGDLDASDADPDAGG